jgi:hypothetical protein
MWLMHINTVPSMHQDLPSIAKLKQRADSGGTASSSSSTGTETTARPRHSIRPSVTIQTHFQSLELHLCIASECSGALIGPAAMLQPHIAQTAAAVACEHVDAA